jgi:hypothetical protein
MAQGCTVHGADALSEAIERLQAAGCDELILVPTSADLAELDAVIELVT